MSEFKIKTINTFFKRAVSVLERLDALLPQAIQEPNWAAVAFRWEKVGQQGVLQVLPTPHTFPLSRLAAVDGQMQKLVRNTEQFLASRPANNVLLSGARGTGKSSLVKALLHEYSAQGLRLIEVDKEDLSSLPSLLNLLVGRPEKFIVFCDDLSFEQGEVGYKALKTALDGGLSQRADNVLVYATSNRRHLLPEYFSENAGYTGMGGEVHPQEAIEEKVSLSDRFGLWLSFYPFDQIAYLQAVENWLQAYDVAYDEVARQAALNWSLSRGGRSGRVAWQFVCDWVGRESENRILD